MRVDTLPQGFVYSLTLLSGANPYRVYSGISMMVSEKIPFSRLMFR